jgi:hypothetical protein
MLCPHCGMNDYKSQKTPLNVIRIGVNTIIYAIFLLIDLWEDPPRISVSMRCHNCGLVGKGEAYESQGLPSFCRRCGYNLTGNVSGRCSECGESTDKATESGN